jgi:hypothetical protein
MWLPMACQAWVLASFYPALGGELTTELWVGPVLRAWPPHKWPPQGGNGPRLRRAGPEGGPKKEEAAPRGQDPNGPLTCKGKKGAARRRRMQLSDFALGVRGG